MRIVLAALLTTLAAAAETTVIYNGATTNLAAARSEASDLWLTLPDLTRAGGFVLKPEGACLKELCVPIPKARQSAFLRTEGGTKLFNLAELARTLKQAVVHDAQYDVWMFGARPDTAAGIADTFEAPDFTLPDWKGVPRSLASFRGKKVLLITWASW
jgi:hypothetical protein